jgi:hypothetical protein
MYKQFIASPTFKRIFPHLNIFVYVPRANYIRNFIFIG